MIHAVTSRRLALQLAALILFVAAASGYLGWRIGSSRILPGPPPVRSIDETMADLTEELNLTEAQVLRIRPILARRQQLAAEHARGMAARMNAFAAEMREVLDDRQRAIFDERTRAIRAKAQQRRANLGKDADSEQAPKE
jgi:hypothetical protein